MARRKPKRIVEHTKLGYVLHLDGEELDLLSRLMGELRALLLADDPNTVPLLRRLYPPAYHLADDAEAEAEYQKYMREELVASRLEAINVVDAALTDRTPFDEEGMLRFIQSLNSLRLVLGTLLDVDEHHDPTALADDDPMLGEHHLYAFLSWLLDASVGAVTRPGT